VVGEPRATCPDQQGRVGETALTGYQYLDRSGPADLARPFVRQVHEWDQRLQRNEAWPPTTLQGGPTTIGESRPPLERSSPPAGVGFTRRQPRPRRARSPSIGSEFSRRGELDRRSSHGAITEHACPRGAVAPMPREVCATNVPEFRVPVATIPKIFSHRAQDSTARTRAVWPQRNHSSAFLQEPMSIAISRSLGEPIICTRLLADTR